MGRLVDGRSEDRSTFFQKPSRNRIGVRDCLLGQLNRILDISDAGLKQENWKVLLDRMVSVEMK